MSEQNNDDRALQGTRSSRAGASAHGKQTQQHRQMLNRVVFIRALKGRLGHITSPEGLD